MKNKQPPPSPTEIQLFDDTLLYKRGDYWQMRIWLAKEGKYARFSLRTMKEGVAREKADDRRTEIKAMQLAGKKYFSLTAKQGVELYLKQRMKDVEAELIVIGRYKTIRTHLEHWLNYIDRDTKLKDLQISDCENYFHERRKSRKTEALKISQTTIMNEQSTINAMMSWLYRQKETYIESFIFQKFKKIDKGDPSNRRPTFTDQEIEKIIKVLARYIQEPAQDKNDKNNLTKAIAGNYLGFSIMSGMRRGEMLQLRWSDIEPSKSSKAGDNEFAYVTAGKKRWDLYYITVRGVTSKVRQTRKFLVKDWGFLIEAMVIASKRLNIKSAQYDRDPEAYLKKNFDAVLNKLGDDLIFSIDGEKAITPRVIEVHFSAVVNKAEILSPDSRGLVPYSFRHYFITQRVNAGLDLMTIAEMCGTSPTQIQNTYYHTSKEKMRTNALADYDIVDGKIVRH